MKDVSLNFDKYYINQGDPDYANIRFKNSTKISSYGCGVCCIAMIICKTLNLTTVADKQAVIKKVIADATNADGLLTYADINYKGKVFKCAKAADLGLVIQENEPGICRLNGHYVLINGYDTTRPRFEAFLIKDPGAFLNFNLAQPMKKYGEAIKDRITVKLQ